MKMLPPTVVVSLRLRRGRPPLRDGEQSTPVCVRVKNHDYDRICTEARQAGMTVAEFVRSKVIPVINK
jgi:hypothetical protein